MRNRLPRARTDEGMWDTEHLEEKSQLTAQWGMVGPRAYKGLPPSSEKLPSGVYSVTLDRNDERSVFIRRDVKTDDIFELGDPLLDRTLMEVRDFWGLGKKFKKFGFLHRRGYLFYGPQGTGKSSVVKQLMNDVIKEGGVVLLCDNPKFFDQGLTTLRQGEPGRRIMCVFEDIDTIIARYGEDELLAILDGANMVNTVLNVATTNYPEKLDKRIVSRPRRFDRVVKVDVPNAGVRAAFFRKQIPKISAGKLAKLVTDTEGLSMAALAEVVISTYCLGNSMTQTLEILRAMEAGNPNSDEFGTKSKFGFAQDFGGEEEGDNILD